MIMLIVIGASFLNFTLASAGLGRELTAFMTDLGLTPLKTILVVVVLYIVLGFFIETLSLMVVTIPIIVPLVVEQGYRYDLVRHPDDRADRNGADHAAGGIEPLRGAGRAKIGHVERGHAGHHSLCLHDAC